MATTHPAPHRFTLVNETGYTIYALYISPSASDDWGENILDMDVLEEGQSLSVPLEGGDGIHSWDLLLLDASLDELTYNQIDLSAISKMTIFYDDLGLPACWVE